MTDGTRGFQSMDSRGTELWARCALRFESRRHALTRDPEINEATLEIRVHKLHT